ncbi:MAG: DUF4388 domain-containing protein [Anaerolineae bacterium]|nr:DUF4388 domain-containing protein [Anaerolineae bacterium]
MALHGNLRDFGTTQLLNLVHLAHKTGSLQLEHNSRSSELYFREGKLIHAQMTGDDGLLTSMLVKNGKLSTAQAQAIQTRASGYDDKRLAMILIQNGYVSKEDVIQSATKYLLDIVYRLFAWTEGQFRFEAERQPDRQRLTIPIELSNVIMEGSRRVQEWERLQDELPDLDMALKFTDRPDDKLKRINLTVQEWKIISYVKPTNSIRQIAKANAMTDFQIRKVVYGMLQAGLVELVRPPGLVVAVPGSPSGTAVDRQRRLPGIGRGIISRLIERIKSL